MKFVADFHIHSKYSRATSRNMDIPNLAEWAKYKGIKVLGTGDFTHHLWLSELKRYLEPREKLGLFFYQEVYFILSVEISNIFSQNGRGYRVHNTILVPTFKMAEEVNSLLSHYGNLASDGRPILGMSCKLLAQELRKLSPDIMLIPSHIWTPWFSVFGSNSGFNSLDEAFDTHTDFITALETGLSSDPLMNWRLSALDQFSLVSNSDSHSPQRIGREANVFDCDLSFWELKKVLKTKDKNKFLYTIEFYPEEGKYHFDGHRNCKVRLHPKETMMHQGKCPECGRPVTKGVLYRVNELADREEGYVPENAIPYKSLVSLDEIIAEIKGADKKSKSVLNEYRAIISEFGSELAVLLEIPDNELSTKLPLRIAEGIQRVRDGKLTILPGYDGEYGSIRIFEDKGQEPQAETQFTLF